MKKILVGLLCAIMALGISGCGSNSLHDKLSKEFSYDVNEERVIYIKESESHTNTFNDVIWITYYNDEENDDKNNYNIHYQERTLYDFNIYQENLNLIHFSLGDVLGVDDIDDDLPSIYLDSEMKLAYDINEKELYYDFDIDDEDEARENLFCEVDVDLYTCIHGKETATGSEDGLLELKPRITKNINKVYKSITNNLDDCGLKITELDATYKELAKEQL